MGTATTAVKTIPLPRLTGYANCSVCGWQYVPGKPDETRCNLCRVAASVRKTQDTSTINPRICQQCDQVYYPRSANSKFCTVACRREAEKSAKADEIQQMIDHYTKPCVVCQRPFLSTDTRKKTCSNQCWRANKQRTAEARRRALEETRHCVECDTVFTVPSKRSRTVTCSEACQHQRRRRQARKREAGYRATARGERIKRVEEPLPPVNMVALKDRMPGWLKGNGEQERRRLAAMLAEADEKRKGAGR